MDCLQAQAIVAEALDHGAPDAAVLEQAKQHCRRCEECGRFVRGQLALKRATPPSPPADLADRVMTAVRAAAAERARAEAAAAEAACVPGASESGGEMTAAVVGVGGAGTVEAATSDAAQPATTLVAPLRRGNRQPMSSVWVALAASVLLFAGVGALTAVTFYARSQTGQRAALDSTKYATSATPESAPLADTSTSAQAPATAPSGGAASTAVSFITIDGIVYRYTTDSTVSRISLSAVSSTTSSLDTGGAPTAQSVLAQSGNRTTVYVEEGERLLQFERVTRSFDGRTYDLRSGPIPAFGVWPSLPPEIASPTEADGSPTFEAYTAGAADNVYVKKGSQPSEGIALPPSAAGGSVAGVPSWTWWTPE